MRSIRNAALHLQAFALLLLAACLAAPVGASLLEDEREQHPEGLTIRDYFARDSFAEFSLPCAGCLGAADESLVLQLQVKPTDDISSSDLWLNYNPFSITWDNLFTESQRTIHAHDTSGVTHTVNLSWVGVISASPLSLVVPGYATQTVHFNVTSVDDSPTSSIGFTVVMRPTSTQNRRLMRLVPDSTPEVIEFHYPQSSFSIHDTSSFGEEDNSNRESSLDLVAELHDLGLLEAQAAELNRQIAAKKQAMSEKLRDHRSKLCLKHLIKECDGVVCAAKVIAQRICDHIGINTTPTLQYSKVEHHQHSVNLDEKQNFTISSKQSMHTSHQAMHMPLVLTKNASAHAAHTFQAIDFVNPPNPIIRILGIIAGVLGLTALWALIKRKCTSARKRADRAADREERKNQRAYRRAARRAAMRKRWDNFLASLNCFRQDPDTGSGDYEEKRALILQDAFLEQELDLAEKGEIMEAEIRELRYAHEIVSSLVRVDEHRYELVTPIHDPPPPLVPLPSYTSGGARSIASTHTLPSYTSESLPDYASRPSGERRFSTGSSVGFTPSTTATDEDGRSTPELTTSSTTSETSGPSSVLDVSPRPSAETLRTSRRSGETF